MSKRLIWKPEPVQNHWFKPWLTGGLGQTIGSLALLHQYPHAHITASDVSLSQTPSREWLPPSMEVCEWDFYTPVPQQWVGRFDVVHIRLALLAIRSNDTSTVLESARAMLKPGGWMQWDELDPREHPPSLPRARAWKIRMWSGFNGCRRLLILRG